MAVYPTWKIRYGIGIESAGWGTGVAAGTKIPTNGPKGIWMNNLNINFDSGQEFADARKATGVSYRKIAEYTQGLKKPNASFEWEASAYNIAPFLYGLFHKLAAGTEVEAAVTFIKTFLAYGLNPNYALVTGGTTPNWAANDIPMSLSMTKDILQSGTTEGHRLEGCVPSSIKLSGTEGAPLMITVDMLAYDYDFNADATTSASYTVAQAGGADAAPLMWQAATFQLANAAGTLTENNCSSWEATFTNNAVLKFGDAQNANRVIFGNFGMTGSFTIPWDGANTIVDDYNAGTDRLMFVYWGDGTVSSTGELNIVANVRFTSAEMADADGEVVLNVGYEAVLDGTDHSAEGGALPTTSPVKVQLYDGIDYGAE